jgi:sulfite reductase (ferredoxin)
MERRLNVWLDPPRQLRWDGTGDHVGWHQQPDGRWYLGVFVENGRIQDSGGFRYKTGFRNLVQKFKPGIRLTATQNILFTHIEEKDRPAVEALLRDNGVLLEGEFSHALRHSMACPAMPTCGLALAESERSLPPVVRRIETILAELGLGDERMSIRMTGCPNGCARPFLGDIGFVGRTPGKYQLYVGGDFEGTRLNELLADLVPGSQLADRLRPLFLMFREERLRDEGFGDFCHRVGIERLKAVAFPDAKPAPVKPTNGQAAAEAAREAQPAVAAAD